MEQKQEKFINQQKKITFGKNTYSHTISLIPVLSEKSKSISFQHLHDQNEIIYFISGNCTLVTEDFSYSPTPGDIVFIPANKYHFLQLTGTDVYERIVLNFYGSETIDTLLSCAFENRHFINVSADGKFAGLFERFEEYRDTLQAWQFEVVASSLLHEFLCLCCGNSLSQTKNIKSSEKILKGALNYINKNLTTIEDIQEIADAVFVSSSYIYQLFQKKLRISPKRLLAQKRLLLARSCILSGEPPYAVYQKCGYKDYSTFYRAYKSQFQQSPAESE